MGCAASTSADNVAPQPKTPTSSPTKAPPQQQAKPGPPAPPKPAAAPAPAADKKADAPLVTKPSAKSAKKERPWIYKETEDIRKVYSFDKILGKGQFGTTRLAIHRETGEKLACKSISKRKLNCQEDIDDVRREIQILHHLAGHPNVVQIKGVYEDTEFVHILMEIASGGELFDRIVARGHYSEKDAATAFRTMVSVIAHCHNMGVIHRDLKPENFLLADSSDHAPLKATDFGISVFFKEGEVFTELVGSAYYVAPEVLKRQYGKEADIWSLGVMLYILLSGVPPFYGETEEQIFQEVLTGSLDLDSGPWASISQAAKDLVKRLLNRDPSKRLTAGDVLKNPWVMPDGVARDQPIQSEVVTRLQGFAAMNKLKKEALKIIVGFLPETEIMGLRQMFKSIDADGSGTITVAELRHALKAKGTLIPEADITRLVADTDVNGDGTIDYEEFLAATVHQSKLQQEEHLYKAFQVLDSDGSGFIDKSELIQALGGQSVDMKEMDGILQSVDTDGDGRIDYEEFCAMMRAKAASTGAAPPKPRSRGASVHDRSDIVVDGDKVHKRH